MPINTKYEDNPRKEIEITPNGGYGRSGRLDTCIERNNRIRPIDVSFR
jgi:hypothetical protein